jgi:hypothetical protein
MDYCCAFLYSRGNPEIEKSEIEKTEIEKGKVMEKLYNIPAAVEATGYSDQYLRQLCREKKIPHIRRRGIDFTQGALLAQAGDRVTPASRKRHDGKEQLMVPEKLAPLVVEKTERFIKGC